MKQEIQNLLQTWVDETPLQCGAVSVIDFKTQTFETVSCYHQSATAPKMWFDLASMTKALVLGGNWLAHPERFHNDLTLLLEHRGGLPFWGRLSKADWRETVSQYQIKESDVVYSDFSALRLTKELESHGPLFAAVEKQFYEVCHWTELDPHVFCPVTGSRKGQLLTHEVHDDNCFVIGEKIGHAGLFGTIEGVSQTLLNYNQSLGMIDKLKPHLARKEHRYVKGFDTVTDLKETLAGEGASLETFGHLGFTGTSFWIHPDMQKGWVLLTNGCFPYWYDRLKLNHLRRQIGHLAWL